MEGTIGLTSPALAHSSLYLLLTAHNVGAGAVGLFDVSKHTTWATTVETGWAMEDQRSLQDLMTQVGNFRALSFGLYTLTRTVPCHKEMVGEHPNVQ